MTVKATWPVMVLAHNEERHIRACLDSIFAADPERGFEVFVMANGCTDATAEIVMTYADARSEVRLVSIALADKCNAWNVFIHETVPRYCPGRDLYFFMDGDARAARGSFTAMAEALEKKPHAHAAAGLPVGGHNAARDRRELLREHGLMANLYTLRGKFVERLQQAAVRLPLKLEGDDGLLGALIKWDLAPEHQDFDPMRIVPCEAAGFAFESMSIFRPRDWPTYWKRAVRYGRRRYEFELLRPVLKNKGVPALPADITELYDATNSLSIRWDGFYTVANFAALRQMRSLSHRANRHARTLHILRSDALGGLERSTAQIVSLLRDQVEQQVLFLSPLRNGISRIFAEQQLPAFAVPYDRRHGLGWVVNLFRHLRATHPQVVLVHGCFGLHAIIAIAARLSGIRRVWVVVVNRPPMSGLSRIVQQLMAHLARPFVYGEIAVTRYVADRLTEDYLLPRSRVRVVYRWRTQLGTLDRPIDARSDRAVPVLGMVARLDWIKDHATVLRACQLLFQELPKAQLILVGDGPERSRLETLARQLGIERRTSFLGHTDRVAPLLAGMDIFLFATSPVEGIAGVLLEAMNAKVPIVCTDVGPCREVLNDGSAGILVPPKDPRAMARAVVDLWRDTQRREQLAKAASEWAAAVFTPETSGRRFIELIYPELGYETASHAPARARG